MKNKRNAFTLVELLAVIVILAVILVIAVPKIMSVIEDTKKATLESTAKMIASGAEKTKVQNQVLGKDEEITCESVSKLNDVDYERCSIEFNGNTAYVSIKGIGKFEGLYICKGTKNNSKVVDYCPNEKVRLDINTNEGNISNDISGIYKEGDIIELETPTRQYYKFIRWEVTSGNSEVNDNTITIGSENTIIKALWEQNVFEIAYELNGGTLGENSPLSGTYGETVTLIEPIKEGYIFNSWIVNGNGSSINGDVLTIGSEKVVLTAEWKPTGATYISNLLAKENELNNGLVHTTVVIDNETIDVGIRYAGLNPKNKVYFNCKDIDSNGVAYAEDNYDYANYCEIWKIIGVFDVKDGNGNVEKRVKIVRDVLKTTTWDTTAGEAAINQWGESTLTSDNTTKYPGASLMQYLNGNTEGNYYYSLSNVAKEQIEDAHWYTGAYDAVDATPAGAYKSERGTTTGTGTTVNYTTTWIGKIGLISVSDFGYAAIGCTDLRNYKCGTNWLKQSTRFWTMTPLANHADYVWYAVDSNIGVSSTASDGGYFALGHVTAVNDVRPALYLSSNVQIIGGNGDNEPYLLKSN